MLILLYSLGSILTQVSSDHSGRGYRNKFQETGIGSKGASAKEQKCKSAKEQNPEQPLSLESNRLLKKSEIRHPPA